MLTYKQFITDLNSGIIVGVDFNIVGYSHYSNCRIYWKHDTIKNGKTISLIRVDLTDDYSEFVSFMDRFNESYKLFRMGRRGSFTLRQVWDKIEIVRIEYKKN